MAPKDCEKSVIQVRAILTETLKSNLCTNAMMLYIQNCRPPSLPCPFTPGSSVAWCGMVCGAWVGTFVRTDSLGQGSSGSESLLPVVRQNRAGGERWGGEDVRTIYCLADWHIDIGIEVAQSCPTLCDPMDCGPPGSSVHGIFQARVLEWGAIAFSVRSL